ncbi:hypothetical protein V8352_18230 [Roseovarius sp. D0-M9]
MRGYRILQAFDPSDLNKPTNLYLMLAMRVISIFLALAAASNDQLTGVHRSTLQMESMASLVRWPKLAKSACCALLTLVPGAAWEAVDPSPEWPLPCL